MQARKITVLASSAGSGVTNGRNPFGTRIASSNKALFTGCGICTILFEEAILAIRYHLRAMIALKDAIQL